MSESKNYSPQQVRELKPFLSEAEKFDLAEALEARQSEEYDTDALTLAGGASWLSGTAYGDRDLVGRDIYRHGTGLKEREQERLARTRNVFEGCKGRAALEFALAYGRAPGRGDILSYRDAVICQAARLHLLNGFIEAWERQVPDKPCPVRHEGGKVFKLQRVNPLVSAPLEWVEDSFDSLERRWSEIAQEAGGVLFLDEGQCRAATEQELSEFDAQPTGGILGVLAKAV